MDFISTSNPAIQQSDLPLSLRLLAWMIPDPPLLLCSPSPFSDACLFRLRIPPSYIAPNRRAYQIPAPASRNFLAQFPGGGKPCDRRGVPAAWCRLVFQRARAVWVRRYRTWVPLPYRNPRKGDYPCPPAMFVGCLVNRQSSINPVKKRSLWRRGRIF